MIRQVVALLITAAVPLGAASAASRSEPTLSSPEAAAGEFIDAFNALDSGRFDRLFAQDSTLFFPSAPFPVRRVSGKAEVNSWFNKFFGAAKKAGKARLNISPTDMSVQNYGDVAVVTFHLEGSDGEVGRRTLVLRKNSNEWRVVHLHASSQKAGSGGAAASAPASAPAARPEDR